MYTERRFWKSCAFVVAKGYVVWSEWVMAFMKFDRDRGSILKNGSRIGYLNTVRAISEVGGYGILLFAPAQGDVLQDMRDSRRIRGIGFESNGEDVVWIISRNMQVLGTRLVVLQVQSRHLQLG